MAIISDQGTTLSSIIVRRFRFWFFWMAISGSIDHNTNQKYCEYRPALVLLPDLDLDFDLDFSGVRGSAGRGGGIGITLCLVISASLVRASEVAKSLWSEPSSMLTCGKKNERFTNKENNLRKITLTIFTVQQGIKMRKQIFDPIQGASSNPYGFFFLGGGGEPAVLISSEEKIRTPRNTVFIHDFFKSFFFIFIDREAGEIIRLVASVCPSVCVCVCVFVCALPLEPLGL